MQKVSDHAHLNSSATPVSFLGESSNTDACSTANNYHARFTAVQESPRGVTGWHDLHVRLAPVALTCVTNAKLKAAARVMTLISQFTTHLSLPSFAAAWGSHFLKTIVWQLSNRHVLVSSLMEVLWPQSNYGYDTSLCFHSKYCAIIIFVFFLSSITKKPKISGYKSFALANEAIPFRMTNRLVGDFLNKGASEA